MEQTVEVVELEVVKETGLLGTVGEGVVAV